MREVDIRGERFGHLVAIRKTGKTKHNHSLWKCVCDCGGTKITALQSLRSGSTKSCGCLHREIFKKIVTKHGMCYIKGYSSWRCMNSRCYNPKDISYHNYGGRGITVCKRWLDIKNFIFDMGERPEGLTLERINNDKGYCKENCKWATYTEQSRNKRTKGDSRCLLA